MHTVSDHAVANGSERARYIADGRISRREPQFATDGFTPLTVDQLYRRGFHDAAYAKSRYEAALQEWSWHRTGRMPVR